MGLPVPLLVALLAQRLSCRPASTCVQFPTFVSALAAHSGFAVPIATQWLAEGHLLKVTRTGKADRSELRHRLGLQVESTSTH